MQLPGRDTAASGLEKGTVNSPRNVQCEVEICPLDQENISRTVYVDPSPTIRQEEWSTGKPRASSYHHQAASQSWEQSVFPGEYRV